MFRKIKLLFTLLVFFSLGCSSESSTVSFGYQPFGSNLPFFVAVERGLFEEQGINLEPVEITSANDAANAVINEDIAGNATVPLNVLLNIEENQSGLMKIFMVKATSSDGGWSDYLLIRENSNINSIKDLQGKTIGGYPGSAQQTILRLILEKFIEPGEFKITELPPSVQLQSLEKGQVDALLTYDARAILALQKGIGKVLVENPVSKYLVDPMYGYPYVLSSNFIQENPESARKIIDAMYNAIKFIGNNEAEARNIMAKWSGVDSTVAQQVNLWSQVRSTNIDTSSMQKLADIYFNEGVTEEKIDISSLLIDHKYINKQEASGSN